MTFYFKGTNFCWHIDGYDKIKPGYGFCIHGCMQHLFQINNLTHSH